MCMAGVLNRGIMLKGSCACPCAFLRLRCVCNVLVLGLVYTQMWRVRGGRENMWVKVKKRSKKHNKKIETLEREKRNSCNPIMYESIPPWHLGVTVPQLCSSSFERAIQVPKSICPSQKSMSGSTRPGCATANLCRLVPCVSKHVLIETSDASLK